MDRKEAIEVIKKNYPHVGISGSEFESALRELVPELNENEYERIRTRLIALVEAFGQGKYKDEMLAYLERMKEQKPALRITKGFYEPDGPLFDIVEHQPAEWSEEDENIYNKALDAIYYKDCNKKDDVISALNDLCDLISRKRKVIPPYASWKPSEEQMKAILDACKEFIDKIESL